MEEDEEKLDEKFEEKLKSIVELGHKKDNVLENQEIIDHHRDVTHLRECLVVMVLDDALQIAECLHSIIDECFGRRIVLGFGTLHADGHPVDL